MPRGRRTTKNCATSPRSIKQRERAREALEYRKLGYTYADVAKELRCSTTTARRYVVWSLDRITDEPASDLKRLQSLRLDAMLTGVCDKAIAGDGEAVSTALKIMDMFNKLHGLLASRDGSEGGVSGPVVVVQCSPLDAKV